MSKNKPLKAWCYTHGDFWKICQCENGQRLTEEQEHYIKLQRVTEYRSKKDK